jgi:hypothetical protein
MKLMLSHVLNHLLSIYFRPAVNRSKEWYQLIIVIPIINLGMEPVIFANIEQVGSSGDAANVYRISARTPIILRASSKYFQPHNEKLDSYKLGR